MRIAVLSDIHANLEALQAVQQKAAGMGVDAWVCLGDIVGYGADPGPCVDQVRALVQDAVLGNHDAAAVGLLDMNYFNPWARRAAEWTAARLAAADAAYLAALPLIRDGDDVLYVHADPHCPDEWDYIHSADQIEAVLEAAVVRLCFIGHTHTPFVWGRSGASAQSLAAAGPVVLEEGVSYLVNVGSVGQPRDGDPRACFALWDAAARTLELVRVDYPIDAAQKKILAAGLPPFLAQRLALGH
ncbi:MAG: hypothetical protein GKR89_11285 [Candidatus Latescibacteria bacterium]|nr:hypothetical protein [Candidatus Latescibacterota bacterium]